MDLHIVLVGLNHRTAAVDIREKLALSEFHSPENWAIPCIDPIDEALILSTCNRVEILSSGKINPENAILAKWSNTCQVDPDELKSHIYIHHNLEAVRHIFQVASSLDSMILGEPQILGQLKSAYRDAIAAKAAGSVLSHLMHHAFSVAKRIRNETAIAANAVSISYAAVELARRIFGQMQGHKTMLLGAGEMAELAATHLLQAGIDEIIIANRTYSHGQELAARFNGRAIHFEDLAANLAEIDILIASTGSKMPIIDAAIMKEVMIKRKNRPMFLIDIAVPRDIHPAVNSLDNVYLYDIDDMKDVIEENMANRKLEAAKAQNIIEEELKYFGAWLENLQAVPTIMDIIKRGEDAVQTELHRTLKKLGSIDPKTREAIETMGMAIAKKLNHDPIMYLKKKGMGKDDSLDRIHILRKIFALDKTAAYRSDT